MVWCCSPFILVFFFPVWVPEVLPGTVGLQRRLGGGRGQKTSANPPHHHPEEAVACNWSHWVMAMGEVQEERGQRGLVKLVSSLFQEDAAGMCWGTLSSPCQGEPVPAQIVARGRRGCGMGRRQRSPTRTLQGAAGAQRRQGQAGAQGLRQSAGHRRQEPALVSNFILFIFFLLHFLPFKKVLLL